MIENVNKDVNNYKTYRNQLTSTIRYAEPFFYNFDLKEKMPCYENYYR